MHLAFLALANCLKIHSAGRKFLTPEGFKSCFLGLGRRGARAFIAQDVCGGPKGTLSRRWSVRRWHLTIKIRSAKEQPS
jgi:hypothetical protein